jgi:hypothetical protein
LFLIHPLTSEEVRRQRLKKGVLGKYNYSLSFLDLDEDREEWAKELEKRRLNPTPQDTEPHH